MPTVSNIDQWTPEPKTVLHILKESLPYVETGFTFRSRMTLRAQAAAGYLPVVVTSLGFPRTKGVESFPSVEDVDGVKHYRLDPGSEVNTRAIPFDLLLEDQARMTGAVAAEAKPALVQAGSGFRGYDTALVGLSIASKAGLPFIYEVRGFQEQTWTSDIPRSEKGEYYRRRRAQELRCLEAADAVITIAEAMVEEIIARGISPEKVHLVPNAVDVDRFTPRPKSPDLLAEMGLNGRQVIGYISNLGWREGLTHLIKATELLVRGGHDVGCLIVGDGPERSSLERLAADLGLQERVIFTGHVPNQQIEEHYALIDVFVVPRLNDRASRMVTPLKPLEAMAMNIPVVASDLPALREMVLPDERGLTFQPGDEFDLARVVGELLSDEPRRVKMAKRAREWVFAERTEGSNSARYGSILGTFV
ncbi:MAG TPA: glycosyltransferase family 4 protein [Acidimicrobiia bacterium]|nr:glycosyltransferase family 4 protein [Acidimicrobiia bacterium]